MPILIPGCGKHHPRKPNEVTCDIRHFPNVDVVHDLNVVPWPWPDNTFDGIYAAHVVEHLQSLLNFMNEAWRVLQPGGSLYISTPLAGGDLDLEFADPTHVRCYRIHTFVNYFSPEGVNRFGYTDRAWNIFHLKVEDNCIILHAYPMKK